MFCFFESSDSGFTRYGGKPLEKLFERLSSFQIVEEGLDWHSRSAKHRSSAKNIPVFDDDSHETIVSWRMEHPNGKLGCSQSVYFFVRRAPRHAVRYLASYSVGHPVQVIDVDEMPSAIWRIPNEIVDFVGRA